MNYEKQIKQEIIKFFIEILIELFDLKRLRKDVDFQMKLFTLLIDIKYKIVK